LWDSAEGTSRSPSIAKFAEMQDAEQFEVQGFVAQGD
jgi:hypothetical protein